MSIPSTITFDSLAQSNMPAEHKSAIRRWYDSASGPGGGSPLALAKLHMKAAGEGLRAGGESLLVGGALGALHAKLPTGLDMKPSASSTKGVPVDAVVGVLGLVGGTFAAQEEYGKDLANAGAAALAVFAFRKTNDLVVKMSQQKGTQTALTASQQAGLISKFGAEGGGWAPGSRSWGTSMISGDAGVDPIVAAGARL